MLDSVQISWTALSCPMVTVPGSTDREVAARLQRLWRALGYATSAAFAAHLGVSPTRWNNIELSGALSKDMAFRIVQKVPGITTDYLWFGRLDGVPVHRLRELELEGVPGEQTAKRSR